jgi:hypothetical protein
VLDCKPRKKSRQDESDEPAFLARQPEHLKDNNDAAAAPRQAARGICSHPGVGSAKIKSLSGWKIPQNGF